jgi:hypothetical protein
MFGDEVKAYAKPRLRRVDVSRVITSMAKVMPA